MAAARTLDVLMGADGRARALPAAWLVGGHTLVVSVVSSREVLGSRRSLPAGALIAFGRVATAARRRITAASSRRFALGLLGAYLGSIGLAGVRAIRHPHPSRLQALVGTAVQALMPLEASLLAAANRTGAAAAVAGVWPLARRLTRRRSIT
jgi:4-hydroxybenzoate polyprenyltransferase